MTIQTHMETNGMTINEKLKAVMDENEALRKDNEELRRLLSRHVQVMQNVSLELDVLKGMSGRE